MSNHGRRKPLFETILSPLSDDERKKRNPNSGQSLSVHILMKARMRHSRSTPRSTRCARTSWRFAALLCAFSSVWLAQPARLRPMAAGVSGRTEKRPTYLASAAQNDVLNAQNPKVRAAVLPTVTPRAACTTPANNFGGETKAVNSRIASGQPDRRSEPADICAR